MIDALMEGVQIVFFICFMAVMAAGTVAILCGLFWLIRTIVTFTSR